MKTQRTGEHERGTDPGRVVAGFLDGSFEMAVPAEPAGAELGQPELEKQAGIRLRRRRLGQGATKVDGC